MSQVVAASSRAGRRPVPAPRQRPGLQVVVPRHRRRRRRGLAPLLAAVLVGGSLLLIVIGHASLAQDQVRLAGVQASLTAAQAAHRQDVLTVANLENPARVVGEAEHTLHMGSPSQVVQVPYVSLTTPLPPPKVSPPPAGGSSNSAASPGQ